MSPTPNKRSNCSGGGGTDGKPSSAKKMRSHPPDTVVVVGEGDQQKEFECHSLFLCCASPDYFDSMFVSNMKESTTKRICFPDKNPDEWEEVYSFIDYTTKDISKVDENNVFTLLPWFHLFQMTEHLIECDRTIYRLFPGFVDGHNQGERNAKRKDKVFQLFEASLMYGLSQTLSYAHCQLFQKMLQMPWIYDIVVKFEDIQKIVTIIRNHGSDFEPFWKYVKDDVLEDMVASDSDEEKLSLLQSPLFPKMIYDTVHKARREHQLAKEKKNTKMLGRIIKVIPRDLRDYLSSQCVTAADVDVHCCRGLKKILGNFRYELKGVLTIPDSWDN